MGRLPGCAAARGASRTASRSRTGWKPAAKPAAASSPAWTTSSSARGRTLSRPALRPRTRRGRGIAGPCARRTGCVAKRRRQNPCMVVIHARSPSRAARAISLARWGSPALGGGPRRGDQLAPDPLAKLARRSLGEREGEDRIGADAVLSHRVAVTVDQDARLAGARPRLREHIARACLDRSSLLGRGLGRASDLLLLVDRAHPAPFPAESPLPATSSAPIERSSRQIGW